MCRYYKHVWRCDGRSLIREVRVEVTPSGSLYLKIWNVQESNRMQQATDKTMYPDPDIFLSLIDSLPLHVYAKDREGRFLLANRAYCRRIGVVLQALVGLNDFDVHPKELAEKYRHDDSRIMGNGEIETLEEPWQANETDEECGWVHTIKAPLRDIDSNTIIGTIGIFWDITEKKRGEIALAEERNLLRTLIDNLPDYIYVKDVESRFLVANVAVARLMGANGPEELLGRTDRDFYPSQQAEKFLTDENEVITSGQPVINLEESVTAASGENRWLLTTKVPLRNIDGEIAGVIGIGHDATEQREAEVERRRLESQLQHAQRMETIGTLTAGIAHDFNNLLSVINGYTELMRLSIPAESKNYEHLGRVLTAGRSAARLVAQLLAFSRQQVAQAKLIDVNNEILRVRTVLQRIVGEHISLQFELDEDLWPIRMDPAQLEQIMINIASNAGDAMANGGELLIRTGRVTVAADSPSKHPSLGPGEWVRLVMKDSGEGIKREAREHLFEPFFTTKPKPKGTGLGLATVFGIVKQNKGHIFADSVPGHGAEFTLYFLMHEKSPENHRPVTAEGAEAPYSQGHEVILVVEDDQAIQSLTRTILTDNGYTVYTANNGAEALLALERKRDEIGLILTDIIMPGMNGKMIADEVARRKLGVKVVFMSGYTNDTISKYGILDSGIEFIHKPYSKDELLRKIRTVLDDQG